MAKKETKILLIESDPQIIAMVRDPLEDEGHVVLCAPDAAEATKRAVREQPTLILVAFRVGKIKGDTLARQIGKDAVTSHIPIVMIASEENLSQLDIGPHSPMSDFLIKPFDTRELIQKLNPLIKSQDLDEAMISTGNAKLDDKMGGGVPVKSLTLIEGDSGAGKSVLSQQIIHGSLGEGNRISLFTSENTVSSLVKQMRSLSLDITIHLLLSDLRILPIETSGLGADAPPALMKAMQMENRSDMIFVDSLTSSIHQCTDTQVLGFFEHCKRLCSDGISVIVVVHTHGLTTELLTRIRALCDAHLRLRTEEVRDQLVKTLEVTKVRGADQKTGNIVSFEVEPGWGMKIVPLSKVGV